MKKRKSSILIVLLLIALSVALYILQLNIFHSSRDTGFYILQDIAFLPLQVAIVTVVLGSFLKNREKNEKLGKINMVVNAFFSEAGTEILNKMTEFAKNFEEIRPILDVKLNWEGSTFRKTRKYLKNVDFIIDCDAESLRSLKLLLQSKRDFLLRMIENPNLLEHDTFTDMLLAVFHISEELFAREEFTETNTSDMAHLSNDIKRALKTLLIQWIEYLEHLHSDYPYLYSMEVRSNPCCKSGGAAIVD